MKSKTMKAGMTLGEMLFLWHSTYSNKDESLHEFATESIVLDYESFKQHYDPKKDAGVTVSLASLRHCARFSVNFQQMMEQSDAPMKEVLRQQVEQYLIFVNALSNRALLSADQKRPITLRLTIS